MNFIGVFFKYYRKQCVRDAKIGVQVLRLVLAETLGLTKVHPKPLDANAP